MTKKKTVKKQQQQPQGKASKEISTEQLADMLNANYQQLIHVQASIFEINAEIKRRLKVKS